MTWRSIPCSKVDWYKCGVSRRAAHKVVRNCRLGKDDGGDCWKSGPWAKLTLGELADAGVRAWRISSEYGIGPAAEQVIKTTIDMAAEGQDVLLPERAPDAYVPKCERTEA